MSPYVVLGSTLYALEANQGVTVDFSALISAMNITPGNILTVLASGITLCLALCFAWWGAKKLSRMFMGAFRKGRLRL